MSPSATQVARQTLAFLFLLQSANAIPYKRFGNATDSLQSSQQHTLTQSSSIQSYVASSNTLPSSVATTSQVPSSQMFDVSTLTEDIDLLESVLAALSSTTKHAIAVTTTSTTTTKSSCSSTSNGPSTHPSTLASSSTAQPAMLTSTSSTTTSAMDSSTPSNSTIAQSAEQSSTASASASSHTATQSAEQSSTTSASSASQTTTHSTQASSLASAISTSHSISHAIQNTSSLSRTQPTFSLPSVTPSTLSPMISMPSAGVIATSAPASTQLDTAGRVTTGPILSFTNSEASPTVTVTSSLLTKTGVTLSTPVSNKTLIGVNPFKAIATRAPPSQLTPTGNHPVPTANIVASKNATLQTNKFYANLFLGSEMQSVFTLPYVLNWVNGSGGTKSYGMAVQHADGSNEVNGPANEKIPDGPVSYFTNPINTQQIVLTARELGANTQLTADSLDTFSVNAKLLPSGGGSSQRRDTDASSSKITFPLVQGMGFVTALYSNLRPQIRTAGAFTNVTSAGSIGTAYKYRVSLNDNTHWLIYAIPNDTSSSVEFTLTTNALLEGPANWSGVIQVAKNTANSSNEGLYDVSAGVYATSATLSGAVNATEGEYSLSWKVAGQNLNNGTVLGFALPHMVQSFADTMNGAVQTSLQLKTPTKGNATAVTSNEWTMVENSLPSNMSFTPWSPEQGTATKYSAEAINAIYAAAQTELTENIDAQTDSDSMYYAGKAFSKFASILIAANDICQEKDLAQQGLVRLESAFTQFINNTQKHPLVYDTVWKGVVSSASYGGDSGADFGNTFYNDHHFHYGYFLHAAAVVAHLDPTWLNQSTNRAWIDALARDVSNPSADDTYFPVFRYFDWYQGHSWAHGLYETADGKDQESSSEDVMFSYGLKLWGKVTGDKSMEARGNLMLAVQARSLQSYFLLADDNENQPEDFIGNKATGILFENKVDHTTYFGTNLEYIQGIHMLPLIPASALTRTSTFVQQEWNTYFADNATDPASNVDGGWRGVLYANLALSNPTASYNFFSDPHFDSQYLDGGASRTWYLAFAAGLGGAPGS